MIQQVRVQLDACEDYIARSVADWRVERVIRDRLGPGHGERGRDREQLQRRHLPGALAELAHAKHWGVYWSGKSSDFGKDGDVEGVEVRGTSHRNGHLIVFSADRDDRLVVLGACVAGRVVWLCGGLAAGSCKLQKYLPPAEKLRPGSPRQWWVPQCDLVPLEEHAVPYPYPGQEHESRAADVNQRNFFGSAT